MPSTLGWLILALVLSYAISYLQDIHRYVKAQLKILPALRRVPASLGLSVILRVLVLDRCMHLALASLTRLDYQEVDSPWTMLQISIGSAIVIVFGLQPFRMLSRLLAIRSRRLNFYTRFVTQLDRLSWGALEHQLSTDHADAMLEFSEDKESRLCLLVLFEEKKEVIITHHFDRRLHDGDDQWLYLAFLVGDHNPHRADAAVATYGLTAVRERLADIQAGMDPSEVRAVLFQRANEPSHHTVDIRRMPGGWRKWLTDPELFEKHLQKVDCVPRRCDELVRQFLRQLACS